MENEEKRQKHYMTSCICSHVDLLLGVDAANNRSHNHFVAIATLNSLNSFFQYEITRDDIVVDLLVFYDIFRKKISSRQIG